MDSSLKFDYLRNHQVQASLPTKIAASCSHGLSCPQKPTTSTCAQASMVYPGLSLIPVFSQLGIFLVNGLTLGKALHLGVSDSCTASSKSSCAQDCTDIRRNSYIDIEQSDGCGVPACGPCYPLFRLFVKCLQLVLRSKPWSDFCS